MGKRKAKPKRSRKDRRRKRPTTKKPRNKTASLRLRKIAKTHQRTSRIAAAKERPTLYRMADGSFVKLTGKGNAVPITKKGKRRKGKKGKADPRLKFLVTALERLGFAVPTDLRSARDLYEFEQRRVDRYNETGVWTPRRKRRKRK